MVEVRHLEDHVGDEVEIAGWVETTRSHGKIGFVVVRDGTGVVQVVVPKQEVDEPDWNAFGELSQETTVRITGTVRQDDRAPGGYEMTLTGLDGRVPDPAQGARRRVPSRPSPPVAPVQPAAGGAPGPGRGGEGHPRLLL